MTSDQDEAFEVDGLFWLPEDPEKKIAGILTFDRDTGGRLSLIGSFDSEDDLFNESAKEVATIHGASEKKHYTLDGCLTTHHSLQIFGGIGRQKFSITRIIEGALYDPAEPIDVDVLIIDFSYLLQWSGISGVDVSMTYNETTGFDLLKILSKPVDGKTCSMPDGSIELVHAINHTNEMIAGQAVRQIVRAKFKFDRVIPLDDALNSASDFQDLLTIANDRVAGFERIHLGHPDLVEDFGDGRTRPVRARLYARWRARSNVSTTRTHTTHDMCFTFDQLGREAGLERWMSTAKDYRSQLGRVANTRYNTSMFLQDTLLGRVAALESLHKQRFPNKKVRDSKTKKIRRMYLSERLDDLIVLGGTTFASLFGAKPNERDVRIETWRDRAKDERDDIAHHLGRDLHANAAELYYVAEAAYWLFVIVLLRFSSAPQEVFDHMETHASFQYTGKQLVSFL